MGDGAVGEATRLVVDGVGIDVVERGSGRPLLFLHGPDGIDPTAQWLDELAADFRVIAPWHPGFGHSERPREFRTVADLAFFYQELARELDLRDAVLVGASFGGWVAAEIAVRSTERFSQLVLAAPLGIRVGDRTERSVTDMHALSQEQLRHAMYFDPAVGEIDYSAINDHTLLGIARSREALTFFGWKPYMHNPGLRRWLRHVRIPALLIWGDSDGIVSLDYGRQFAAELPDARLEVVERAGHLPHVERPDRFVELVRSFVDETSVAPAAA